MSLLGAVCLLTGTLRPAGAAPQAPCPHAPSHHPRALPAGCLPAGPHTLWASKRRPPRPRPHPCCCRDWQVLNDSFILKQHGIE